MVTFVGTIREEMADKLNRTDLDGSIYYKAINRAIRYYSKQRFWFNTEDAALTLLDGASELDLSTLTDFYQETDTDGFSLYFNKKTYPLKQIKKAKYDLMNLESHGIPHSYIWINGSYKIYPLADRDYTLNVNYFKLYPDLVNYTDNNDFTNFAEDLIRERALSDMWMSMEHEPEMASYHQQQADIEYAKLLDFTRQKTATGELFAEEERIGGY